MSGQTLLKAAVGVEILAFQALRPKIYVFFSKIWNYSTYFQDNRIVVLIFPGVQIKWDVDLIDSIMLVIVSICVKCVLFYKVFCAKILQSSTFLKMNTGKM